MSQPTVWRPLDKPELGLMDFLSRQIVEIEGKQPGVIPDLRQGKTIYIGSDYGGTHKGAKYETVSFVIADDTSVPTWNFLRKIVRDSYLTPPGDTKPREMAYKKLNDDVRLKALGPFLHAANALCGLSLTVAVDKSIPFLAPDRIREGSLWKEKVFDRALRIVHFVSLLVAGLSRPEQHVYWTTDRDEIVDSEDRLEMLTKILAYVSAPYIPHKMGDLRCGTNEEDEDAILSDYLAIPDLVAGCFGDVLADNQVDVRTASTATVAPLNMERIPDKANAILSWHMEKDHPLQRLFCIIDQGPNPGQLQISWPLYFGMPSPYVPTP